MSSAATALPPLPEWAPSTVTVVGGDRCASDAVARLLRSAGLHPGAVPEPDALVVLLGQGREDARLREVRRLAERYPHTGILAVASPEIHNAGLRRVLIAGAAGIVFEDETERALVPAIFAVLAGQLTVPSALGQQIAPRPLSHREKQILAFVVRGMTNREIAAKLFLAESTVKTHLSSAFRKIDARSRSEAVARIQDPASGFGHGVLAAVDGASV